MPGKPLDNIRHEKFAQLYVRGTKTLADCYLEAGYKTGTRANAKNGGMKLKARPEVRQRMDQLIDRNRVETTVKHEVKRDQILDRLNEVYVRCMQAEPVKDRHGEEIGEWRFDAKGAVASCRLMGIEIGMFKSVSEVWRGKIDPTDGLSHEQLKEFVLGLASELGYDLTERSGLSAAPSESERSRPV